jgi:transcriptional regulator with XRE-family HTH domain
MEPAQSIDLNLREKLKDRGYRQRFFWAECSAHIAEQLISLRKRRGLNQTQVAELANTKQPAISRAEQADYQNRKIETLRAIVEALDGRLRVIIEPSEDVLAEYEDAPSVDISSSGSISAAKAEQNARDEAFDQSRSRQLPPIPVDALNMLPSSMGPPSIERSTLTI